MLMLFFFFFQAEDGIRDLYVTGVQTCALPICGAGEDENLAALAGHVTPVAGVLVALNGLDPPAQQPADAARWPVSVPASAEGAADPAKDLAAIPGQPGRCDSHEVGVQVAVRVHHQDPVLVARARQDRVEYLVQRAGLLVLVALSLDDRDAERPRPRHGLVGAVVSDDDDLVDRARLAAHRRDDGSDLILLIVRGDQDRQPAAGRPRAAHWWRLIRWPLGEGSERGTRRRRAILRDEYCAACYVLAIPAHALHSGWPELQDR